MIAIVKYIDAHGLADVLVRRNHSRERLQGLHPDLRLGDRVEVKRERNNPYLIRVVAQPKSLPRTAEGDMGQTLGALATDEEMQPYADLERAMDDEDGLLTDDLEIDGDGNPM